MKKLSLLALSLASAGAFAQFTIPNFTSGYVQDFDTLINTGSAVLGTGTANSGALPTSVLAANTSSEWLNFRSGTGSTTANNTFTVDTGASSAGGWKSFGAASSTDRALGIVGSGTFGNTSGYALALTNGSTATGLITFDFALEQWRNGGSTATDGFNLSYKLYKGGVGYSISDAATATDFLTAGIQRQVATDNTYTSLSAESAGNFFSGSPVVGGTAVALNGNDAANKIFHRANIQLFGQGLSYDPSDIIVFRFNDIDVAGSEAGFALDDVRVVPEPASMLAIGVGIAGLVARRRKNSK
jgi:hypothetical protein